MTEKPHVYDGFCGGVLWQVSGDGDDGAIMQ